MSRIRNTFYRLGSGSLVLLIFSVSVLFAYAKSGALVTLTAWAMQWGNNIPLSSKLASPLIIYLAYRWAMSSFARKKPRSMILGAAFGLSFGLVSQLPILPGVYYLGWNLAKSMGAGEETLRAKNLMLTTLESYGFEGRDPVPFALDSPIEELDLVTRMQLGMKADISSHPRADEVAKRAYQSAYEEVKLYGEMFPIDPNIQFQNLHTQALSNLYPSYSDFLHPDKEALERRRKRLALSTRIKYGAGVDQDKIRAAEIRQSLDDEGFPYGRWLEDGYRPETELRARLTDHFWGRR